jgi:hypothetical protein
MIDDDEMIFMWIMLPAVTCMIFTLGYAPIVLISLLFSKENPPSEWPMWLWLVWVYFGPLPVIYVVWLSIASLVRSPYARADLAGRRDSFDYRDQF